MPEAVSAGAADDRGAVPGELEVLDAPPTTTDRFAELLEQFGGEAGYRVYLERIDPVDGPAYLGVVPLDDNLLANVQNKWGGGQFGGRIVDGRSRYKSRMPVFRIAGAPRDPTYTAPAPTAAPDAAPVHIAAVLGPLLEGMQRGIVDAIRASQPASDPLAQFTQMVTLARELVPAPAPRESTATMFSTFREMLKLRDELAPASGAGAGGVVDAIREFAPIVRAGLSQLGQRNIGEPGPDPLEGAGGGAPHPAPAPRPAAPIAAAWLQPFLHFRGQLLALADQGKNPGLYADLLADNITDDVAEMIAKADAAGTLEADLFAAVPELSRSPERRAFATALLAELRGALFGSAKPNKPSRKRAAKKTAAAGKV